MARTKPVTFSEMKPYLMPLVSEVNPLGSRAAPAAPAAPRGCSRRDLSRRREDLSRVETDVVVDCEARSNRAQLLTQLVDDGEIDPQLRVLVQLDADDDRLDQHLDRRNVNLLNDLIDDLEVGLVILDHQHILA